MGIAFDKKANEGIRGKETVISTGDSKVKVMIVPTNEEWVIASETRDIVEQMNKKQ